MKKATFWNISPLTSRSLKNAGTASTTNRVREAQRGLPTTPPICMIGHIFPLNLEFGGVVETKKNK